jgi:hypothetical protein
MSTQAGVVPSPHPSDDEAAAAASRKGSWMRPSRPGAGTSPKLGRQAKGTQQQHGKLGT